MEPHTSPERKKAARHPLPNLINPNFFHGPMRNSFHAFIFFTSQTLHFFSMKSGIARELRTFLFF
jgi:hypothetical protein